MRLDIVFEHVQIKRIARRGLLAPQVARGETNAINVLRLVALAVGIGVVEAEHAAVGLDDADLPRT